MEDDQKEELTPPRVIEVAPTWGVEMKTAVRMACPVVVGFLFQMSINLQTVMLLGHKSAEMLAACGLGVVTSNVTGLSILTGLGTGLETLASQAFGAGNYVLVGVLLQRGMLVLCTACVPITAIWFFSGSILSALGIEAELAGNVQLFLRPFLFSLIPMAIFICLQKYFQAQGHMWPITIVMFCVNFFHLLVSWLLIYYFDLGLAGGGGALSLTYAALVVGMVLYIKITKIHKKTWFGWSRDATRDVLPFLKIAIPGAGMVCLEWWGFETAALMIARLGEVATATQTVLLNTIAICFMIPLGLSVSLSNRVGNLLGAGDYQSAKRATKVCILMVVCLMSVFAGSIALGRNYWGKLFNEDPLVLESISQVLPIVMAFELIDSTQGVISGALRGCGKQHVGACLNLAAYWLIGIPLGYVFTFVVGIGLIGMWCGLAIGLTFQATSLLFIVFCFTNWENEAKKAQTHALASKVDGVESANGEDGVEMGDRALLAEEEGKQENQNGDDAEDEV